MPKTMATKEEEDLGTLSCAFGLFTHFRVRWRSRNDIHDIGKMGGAARERNTQLIFVPVTSRTIPISKPLCQYIMMTS